MGAVDEYLAGVEDPADRRALVRVYDLARELAPDAEQGIGYRMPALKHHGKVLISAIRAAKHLGVYPFSAEAVAAVAGRVATIEGADASTGAIRFAPGTEIPEDLIRDLVAFRLADRRTLTGVQAPIGVTRGERAADETRGTGAPCRSA